jgi:excisionase family DNA binding protein
MAATNSELLTIAEAAALLKVDPSTIRRWIRSGRLHALRPGPRTVRVRRSELEREPAPYINDIVGDNSRDPIPVPPMTEEYRSRALEALEAARQLREEQVRKYGVFTTPSWELLHEAREERDRQLLGEE